MPIDLRRAQPAPPRALGIGAAALAVLLVVLTVLVATGWSPLLRLDRAVARQAYDVSAGRPGLVDLLTFVAFWLGPYALRIVLLVAAALALARRERRVALWLVIAVAVELVVAPASKFLLDRPRPVFAAPLVAIGQFSYPSGHAAAAGMFATAAVLLTIVLTPRGLLRRLATTVWVLIALAIGLDRIFLGVHFLSDVVGGYALGALVALVVWLAVTWRAGDPPTELVTAVGTGSKRVAVIVNPTKVVDAAAFRARVDAAAEAAGWNEPSWYETLVDDPGVSMTEAALAAGIDLLVIAGGDGTVRVVSHELARTGVSAGIVPLGTGNLLARNLGIPLHTGDAVDTAFGGQDRAIDIVAVRVDDREETAFTVMAGLGLDAAIMTGAADELKARVGWLAYFVSGVRHLRYPATRVAVAVDGQPLVKHRARTVLVGNVGYLQGGIPLLPDARIDDGVLDVVVIAPTRTAGWVRVIVRVLTRGRQTDARLARLTGHGVVVRADKPTPMQLDGDPIGEGTELWAQIQPGVLLVRVPR